MTLDTIYKEGIKKVWDIHKTQQKKFLEVIGTVREMDSNIIQDVGGFFVPNDEYMVTLFGEAILDSSYGCYLEDDICYWNNYFVFPITNLAGRVVGFAGFNPFRYLEAKETKDWGIHYYSYSIKQVFDKGKYLYCAPGVFEKALNDGYLLLVDGIFDAISLTAAGYNAAAMMGSVATTEILAQLRFVTRVILITDNDEAGIKLFNTMHRFLPNLELLKQGKTKDIDDLLKTKYRTDFLKQLDTVLSGLPIIVHLVSFK